jgi:hypothetical protein
VRITKAADPIGECVAQRTFFHGAKRERRDESAAPLALIFVKNP